MKPKPPNYWTIKKCLSEALKYETRSEWSKKSHGSNHAAKKHGIYEECCKHMKIIGNKHKRRIY